MAKNKKQHYVSRFYLKRFSKNKKSISLYNLKSERKFDEAKLKTQAYRDYFYGKDLVLEGLLGDIEKDAAYLFRQIDELGSLPPPVRVQRVTPPKTPR